MTSNVYFSATHNSYKTHTIYKNSNYMFLHFNIKYQHAFYIHEQSTIFEENQISDEQVTNTLDWVTGITHILTGFAWKSPKVD